MRESVRMLLRLVTLSYATTVVGVHGASVPSQPPAVESIQLGSAPLAPHPRLRLTPAALTAMKTKIARDPLAATVADQLAQHGRELLTQPVVNCTLTGVENSLLGQARTVLDLTYTLGLLYRLDQNATWAARAMREMLHVSVDPSCASWNPKHFLDTAEMMHAVAVGYDWLYLAPADVVAPSDRAKVAEGLATRGLQVAAANWDGWFFNVTDVNWNEVCNGGAIAASLALLDSADPAHAGLAAAVLKNATHNIRSSEMLQYAPDGAWSEGPTYWGYATKYTLVATQMLSTAIGSDTGLGAAPGLDRTGLWRIHNTGPLDKSFNWGDSDDNGADEFLVDFFGLANQPITQEAAVAAFWGRYIFNKTLRCPQAGCALALLDWPADPAEGTMSDLEAQPTCKSFRLSDSGWDNKTALGYFRSDWRQSKCADWNRKARPGLKCNSRASDDQPTWLAFKGGNGEANHNDLDAGTFVFEMAGHRWGVDLGSDSYGLKNYFTKSASHGSRYSYYRKSSRGHNTLTFNGVDEWPGWCAQSMAVSEITYFNCSTQERGEESTGGPHAIIDLTPAYATAGGPKPPDPPTTKVQRGFAMLQNFSRIVVRDEWTAPGADNVTWAMHFFADETSANISTDGRTATLTAVTSHGPLYAQTATATIIAALEQPSTTGVRFEVVTPDIISSGPMITGSPAGHLRKLIVVVDPKQDSTLQVSFSNLGTPGLPLATINPLGMWTQQGPLGSNGPESAQ